MPGAVPSAPAVAQSPRLETRTKQMGVRLLEEFQQMQFLYCHSSTLISVLKRPLFEVGEQATMFERWGWEPEAKLQSISVLVWE